MLFIKIMKNSFRNRPKSVPGAPQAPLEVQAAPKSPQVEAKRCPKSSKSRPKSPKSRPKSDQDAKSGPKRAPKWSKNGAKSGKKRRQNSERFWRAYLERMSPIWSRSCKPRPSKTIVKTMILEGFSFFMFFVQRAIFERFSIDFELQNETKFE